MCWNVLTELDRMDAIIGTSTDGDDDNDDDDDKSDEDNDDGESSKMFVKLLSCV